MAMYAVIRAGGKQHKVSPGDVIEIERVKDGSGKLTWTPLLIVDDKGKAIAAKDELAKATVSGEVVGEAKGPKLDVFRYRNKTGYRRHTGHRQRYVTVKIADIKVGRASSSKER